MNAAFKKEKSFMKLNQVLAMLNQLTLRHELHEAVANSRQRNTVMMRQGSNDAVILEQTLLMIVAKWAVSKILEKHTLATQNAYEFAQVEGAAAGAEQWRCANSHDSVVTISLHLSESLCSCGWPTKLLLPCRHVIAAYFKRVQSAQDLASALIKYVVPRWLIDTLREALSQPDAIMSPSQPQRNSSVLCVPSAPMPATKQMKRIQLTSILTQVRRLLEQDDDAMSEGLPQLTTN